MNAAASEGGGMRPPDAWRRLACFLYEGVLLFGVVWAAGLVYSLAIGQRNAMTGQSGMQAVLFLVLGLYFVWFWSRRGQTLPMQTWSIRLVRGSTAAWFRRAPPLPLPARLGLVPARPRRGAPVAASTTRWAPRRSCSPAWPPTPPSGCIAPPVPARHALRHAADPLEGRTPELKARPQTAESGPMTNPHKGRTGLDRIVRATGYSMSAGPWPTAANRAFRQEFWLAVIPLPSAFWLGRSWVEVALLAGSVLLVLIVELLNSSIGRRSTASPSRCTTSQARQDLASAAVLLSLLLCGGIWLAALWQRFRSDGVSAPLSVCVYCGSRDGRTRPSPRPPPQWGAASRSAAGSSSTAAAAPA